MSVLLDEGVQLHSKLFDVHGLPSLNDGEREVSLHVVLLEGAEHDLTITLTSVYFVEADDSVTEVPLLLSTCQHVSEVF